MTAGDARSDEILRVRRTRDAPVRRGGGPASSKARTMRMAPAGVSSVALKMIEQPEASAPEILRGPGLSPFRAKGTRDAVPLEVAAHLLVPGAREHPGDVSVPASFSC